jgi:hypothetical protein
LMNGFGSYFFLTESFLFFASDTSAIRIAPGVKDKMHKDPVVSTGNYTQ